MISGISSCTTCQSGPVQPAADGADLPQAGSAGAHNNTIVSNDFSSSDSAATRSSASVLAALMALTPG